MNLMTRKMSPNTRPFPHLFKFISTLYIVVVIVRWLWRCKKWHVLFGNVKVRLVFRHGYNTVELSLISTRLSLRAADVKWSQMMRRQFYCLGHRHRYVAVETDGCDQPWIHLIQPYDCKACTAFVAILWRVVSPCAYQSLHSVHQFRSSIRTIHIKIALSSSSSSPHAYRLKSSTRNL